MSTNNTDTGDTVNISTEIKNPLEKNVITDEHLALQITQEEPAPREELITTAVNFLKNAKVRYSTLMQKQKFLRSKGLTSTEVQMACERAGVFTQDSNSPTVFTMGINSTQTHTQMGMQEPKVTAFGRLKDILHSMALLGAVAYGIYMFWKRFLQKFLFGGRKKKSVDDALSDIDKSIEARTEEIKIDLNHAKESLAREQRQQTQQFMHELNQFKGDLESIKGLLLSRKQFAPPSISSTSAPAVPAWQLSTTATHCILRNNQSDDSEIVIDTGSGSGSSENEVVSKNSDSSIEMV